MGSSYWPYLICCVLSAIVTIIRYFDYPGKYVWTVPAIGTLIWLVLFIIQYKLLKKKK